MVETRHVASFQESEMVETRHVASVRNGRDATRRVFPGVRVLILPQQKDTVWQEVYRAKCLYT